MRQLTFIEPGKLEWHDVPEPSIEADAQALVRPLAVATCDIDRGVVRGRVPFQAPFAMGHEGVAEVTEVGQGVSSFAPGDLVSVPFQVSCGECERCRSGQTGNCEAVSQMTSYGMPLGDDVGGFLSDVVRVPFAEAMLVSVPEGIDPEAVASLSDNIPDAWRTVGPPLEDHPGAPVLICAGAGSIALYAAAIAVALGAERVDFAGGRPAERAVAEQLGAMLVDERFPKRLGPYPITVDASSSHDGLSCALRSTDMDGISTSIGIYYEPATEVPLLEMYTKGIVFKTGRCHARPSMPEILELVRDGRFRPELITTQTVAFDDAAEALDGTAAKLVMTRA